MIRLEPIDTVRRIAMRNDDEGRYVMYDEAQARISQLEAYLRAAIDERDRALAELERERADRRTVRAGAAARIGRLLDEARATERMPPSLRAKILDVVARVAWGEP